MTRAFVRINREGKWLDVEFDQLTDAEMEQIAAEQPDRGWIWALFFARWIRDNLEYDFRCTVDPSSRQPN